MRRLRARCRVAWISARANLRHYPRSLARNITLYNMNGSRYEWDLIVNFRDRETERLWETGKSRRFPASLRQIAGKKLAILDAAVELRELHSPPGNRLAKLTGNRVGQHSIRINDQFRICFIWKNGNAHDVEIVDYH